jgi:hypothetical protein
MVGILAEARQAPACGAQGAPEKVERNLLQWHISALGARLGDPKKTGHEKTGKWVN